MFRSLGDPQPKMTGVILQVPHTTSVTTRSGPSRSPGEPIASRSLPRHILTLLTRSLPKLRGYFGAAGRLIYLGTFALLLAIGTQLIG